MKLYCSNTTGQVMILAVLALGGAILSATTIAGLLMVYQIRQSTDLKNSTAAILAADSGIEWGLYQFFKVPASEASSTPYSTNLTNGASSTVNCYGLDLSGPSPSQPLLSSCANASSVQAIGESNGANRALHAYVQSFITP